MTQTEYEDWRPGAVESYAGEHVRAGSMPADDAQEMADKQFADLLPDGVSMISGRLSDGTGMAPRSARADAQAAEFC